MSTPESCKSCVHRYNDVSEGQNCRRLDKKIHLAGGRILNWPGWAVSEAIEECKGEIAKTSIFARIRFHLFM